MIKRMAVLLLLALMGSSGFGNATLYFDHSLFDYGQISCDSPPIIHRFTFTNKSPQPVTIKNVTTSCGCTTVVYTTTPVMPDSSGFVQAGFDPRGREGDFLKHIYITLDDTSQYTLNIAGSVSSAGQAPVPPAAGVVQIPVQTAYTYINENRNRPEFVIMDVRTPEEFATGHVQGAVNLNFQGEDFAKKVSELDKSRTYLVMCGVGIRSAKAAKALKEAGVFMCYNMLGGLEEWTKAGYPTVTD